VNALTQSPTDLATTTPVLFITRWITYLCAPIFVFLAGTSAYFSLQKSKNVASSRFHMIKRGLWLILLDLVIMNFILYFDVQFHSVLFNVVASIGFGFILLGLLLNVPSFALGVLGSIILIGHGLYGIYNAELSDTAKLILNPFLTLSVFPFSTDKIFIVAYPPIPWLGIMLIGFSFGKMFVTDHDKKSKQFITIGLTIIAIFILLRYLNIYGDPQHWAFQKDTMTTLLSFLNVSKYPPSLAFTLVTLGSMFLLLGFAGRFNSSVQRILIVYGKVPLFYYVVHFLLIHFFTLIMLWLQGVPFSEMEFATSTFGRPKNIETGIPLWMIFIIWPIIVAILYLPCKWYWKYKTAHQSILTRYI
jgi:uncharacterized membrane protein